MKNTDRQDLFERVKSNLQKAKSSCLSNCDIFVSSRVGLGCFLGSVENHQQLELFL